jgi:zinc resistance-associated protein
MKKSMIAITSLLAVALLATSAFSWGHGKGNYNKECQGYNQGNGDGQGNGYGQGRGHGKGKGYGQGGNGTNTWNDLSKKQKSEITALRQQFIDETYEIRSSMIQKRQGMKMLMETSSPERTKLDAISQEMTDLQGQMRGKRLDFQLAAKKIAP